MRDFLTKACSISGMTEQSNLAFAQKMTEEERIKMRDQLRLDLKQRLFKLSKVKKGDDVSLNPETFKDFYRLILLELDQSESSQIDIYGLQTEILSEAIQGIDYSAEFTFDQYVVYFINAIRMNPSIWIKNSEMQKKGIIKDKEANFLVNGY